MSVTISIIISVLALLATFYQLRLQRIHNEKSLKPLGQIQLADHKKKLAVYIRNNGLGPLIIDRLTFQKGDTIFSSIDKCLDLDPRAYMHISEDHLLQRVILPNTHLTIFEKSFGDQADETIITQVRKQLAPISLNVEGRDIYDNKIRLERDFKWFSRYFPDSM